MRVVIAFEERDGKLGRGYAKVLPMHRDSNESLKPIFEIHIKEYASVLADEWSGYKPLRQEYPNLNQTLSDQGKT